VTIAATAADAAPTRATATKVAAAPATATAAPGTGSRQNGGVARLKLSRRIGPVGAVLTAWDIWRRLPPQQRKWVARQLRHHGPRVAKQALDAQRNRRRR
jgi:hypothetical protein